ncbi:MAG: phosphoribosylformylglycinamidine synthase subunit PurS [Thermoplasmata archaeon]
MVVAEVKIELKKGVTDPEGMNTKKALNLLGWEVESVKTGKVFHIDLGEDISEDEAEEVVNEMCRRILANPVIQAYHINLEG